MSDHRLVKVVWRDIQGLEDTWETLEEIRELSPVSIETVGWIIVESEEYITMTSSLSTDKTFGGSVTAIPKGCIDSVVVVSEASGCFDKKI